MAGLPGGPAGFWAGRSTTAVGANVAFGRAAVGEGLRVGPTVTRPRTTASIVWSGVGCGITVAVWRG